VVVGAEALRLHMVVARANSIWYIFFE
jgi:hypothetical protein